MRVGEHFCPGILHAVPARDGLLLRIRVPGGRIEPDQFRAIADLSRDLADGSVEITSRANLQLRAIRSQDLERIVRGLSNAGLLPSPEHDRVRNIITSPIAGADADEIVDPGPLVQELDLRLRSQPDLAGLHPKFSFAIFGGPRRFSRETDDVSLRAERSGAVVSFRISIGGIDSGFAVRREHVADAMLSAAATCMALATEYGVPARAKQIVVIDGAMQRILSPLLRWIVPSAEARAGDSIEEALLGVYPASEAGCCIIAPSVPLGRLTAAQAACVAEAASGCGGDLRLTPWRAVVLVSVPQAAVQGVIAQLHAIGLPCDVSDGFRGIAACAGITGCDASLADVRSTATLLAQRLAGAPAPGGWTVNISGCEKQCGRRHQASADLVATPEGYSLHIAGQQAAHICSQIFAIDAIAAEHQNLLSEVAVQ